MRTFRSPGEAGGDVPAVTPEPDATSVNTDHGGQEGGEGGEKPVENETPEQILTRITKERDDAVLKNTELSSKFGKQSGQVATMKQMANAIQNDPKGLIKLLSKNSGIDIKFADEIKPDLAKALETGTTEDQVAAIKASQEGGLSNEDRNTLASLVESQIASKYSDFDDLTSDREALTIAVASGQITEKELYHLAARGSLLASAADEIGKKAVNDYKEQLNTKNQEQISESGQNVTVAEKSEMIITDVLKGMETIRS